MHHTLSGRRLTVSVALPIVMVSMLTACGGSSDSATTSPGTSTGGGSAAASEAATANGSPSAAGTPADRAATLSVAQGIMARYDKDNNVAIGRSENPPYDEDAWSTVDVGPARRSDTHSTRITALERGKIPKGYRYTHQVTKVYGSTSRSSDGQAPVLFLAGMEKSTGAKPGHYVSVMTHTKDGWREWADVSVVAHLLPEQVTTVPTLSRAQRQTAANAVPAVADALQLGEMREVSNPGPLTSYRKGLHKDLKGFRVDVTPRPWGTPKGTEYDEAVTVGTPALRLVRVGSSTLGLMSFDARVEFDGTASGSTISLSKSVAKVEGNNGKSTSHLVRRNAIEVLVQIPDKGKPRVLGLRAYYLIP